MYLYMVQSISYKSGYESYKGIQLHYNRCVYTIHSLMLESIRLIGSNLLLRRTSCAGEVSTQLGTRSRRGLHVDVNSQIDRHHRYK